MAMKNDNENSLWARLEKDPPTEDEQKWAFTYILEHPALTYEQVQKDGLVGNAEEAVRRRDLLLMMFFHIKVVGGGINLFKRLLNDTQKEREQ